ncbi:MAG: hypothetical protein IM537_17435, partial [Pseudanabaena sp. M57BS1SP1A06MG]|nr:hypothetical protein [Pseudanabaena sp. M57BS1SP1A06MG]
MLEDIGKLSRLRDGEVWMTDHGKVYCSNSSKTSPDLQNVLTNLAKLVKRDTNASILDLSTLKDKEIKQVENYRFAHPNAEHVIQKILHVESDAPGVMEAHDQFLNTTYDKLEEKLFTDFGFNLNQAINSEQFPDLFTQVQHKRKLIDDTIKVLTDVRANTEDCQNVDTMLASLGSEEQIQQWLEHMHQQGYSGATVILAYRTTDLNEKLERYASAAEKGNFEALLQLLLWEEDPLHRMEQLSHLIDLGHPEAIKSSPQLKYEASYALFDKASNYEAEEYEEIVAKGYALMREAAEEGNVWAKIDLAQMEEDPETKIERLSELKAQGFTEAHDSLAEAKQELANTLFSSTSYLSKKEKESIRAKASQLLQEAADMGNEKAIISLASHLIHGSHGFSINRESAREILEKIFASSNSELAGKAHLLIAESYQGTENSSDNILRHLAAAILLGAGGNHPDYVRNGPKEAAEVYAFLKFSETYPELDLTTFIDEKLASQSKKDYIHAIQQILQGERQLQMQRAINGKRIDLAPPIFEKLRDHLLKTNAINNDHNKYFNPRRVDILGAKGIEIILNDINEKKHYFDEMPCSICEGLNNIQETVTKVIKDLMVSPNAGKRGVVIIGETGHVLPLYIEKNQKGQLKIINTDSAPTNYGTIIYEHIVASLREMHIQPTEIEIIGEPDASFQRQHDYTSCPIFTIRDLVQFARTHETVQFFDNQEKTHVSLDWMGDYMYTSVKNYPPALMNTMQSLNSLERYDLQMGLASKNEDMEVEYS